MLQQQVCVCYYKSLWAIGDTFSILICAFVYAHMQTHTRARTLTTDREVSQEGLEQQPEVRLANRLHSVLALVGHLARLQPLLLLVQEHSGSLLLLPPLGLLRPSVRQLLGDSGSLLRRRLSVLEVLLVPPVTAAPKAGFGTSCQVRRRSARILGGALEVEVGFG